MKTGRKPSIYLFTLLELVTVILIIALLCAIAVPAYHKYIKRANKTAARAQIQSFILAVTDFRGDMGKIPNSLDELVRNESGEKKWDGPYLGNTLDIPKDPWGNEYVYQVPGPEGFEFEIISYGSDGLPSGTGEAADISSIMRKEE